MKLKEINNLFNEIDYFKGFENKEDYYQEFIFLFGERDLLTKVENLYNTRGSSSIGALFNLHSPKWIELVTLNVKIKSIGLSDKTVTTTGTKSNKGDKTRKSNTNNVNEITPFDVDESLENEKNVNVLDEVESNSDDLTTENKVIYSGFSKEQLDYFQNKFETKKDYRCLIYEDITNMLTLQLYNDIINL